MFSVWDLDLSLGLVRNNKHLLFLQQKQNIKPQLMPVMNIYGFDTSFQSLDLSSSNLLHFGETIKVPSSLQKIQFYINTANTLSYTCNSSKILFMIMFLKMLYFPTNDQVVDIFTKSFTEVKFSKLRSMLGVQECVIKGGQALMPLSFS